MPWRICIPVPNDKTKLFCFHLPVYPQSTHWQPPGTSVRSPSDPSPWKWEWADSESISPDLQRQLSTLAAIDGLASHLGSPMRDSIQKIARDGATRHGDLPPSVSLRFE